MGWVDITPLTIENSSGDEGRLVAVDPSKGRGLVEAADGQEQDSDLRGLHISQDASVVDWDLEKVEEVAGGARMLHWSATVLTAGTVREFEAQGYSVASKTVRARARPANIPPAPLPLPSSTLLTVLFFYCFGSHARR